MPSHIDYDLKTEIVRLNKVIQALMNRAERMMNIQGSNFGLFETTVLLEMVHGVAERARASLSSLKIPHAENDTATVTISAGVAAMIPSHGHSIEQFIDLADTALYAATHKGRNRVQMRLPVEPAAGPVIG